MKVFSVIALLLGLAVFNLQATPMSKHSDDSNESNVVFEPMLDGKWIGLGIAYGSYRDGESPKKESVSSEADILEDMKILTSGNGITWNLIRMYAADAASEQVLKTIKKHKLPVKVMQGAWLSSDQTDEENETQISEVIRLANEYPGIVVTVNLGNEIFVDWSAHKLVAKDVPKYLGWVERVKRETMLPVTLADDYNFYNKPWSKEIVGALDYIVLHAYAMWNSQSLDNAVAWTEKTFNDIQELHPNKQIVLGESGWATSSVSDNGDERLIIGEPSEKAQATFFKDYRNWLETHKITSFYFEAFDEKWKGGEDKPDTIAEKNWGVFRSDRTAKKAVKQYNKP
jgi:exo-beta-1,3-glucanase (GH17 family)